MSKIQILAMGAAAVMSVSMLAAPVIADTVDTQSTVYSGLPD